MSRWDPKDQDAKVIHTTSGAALGLAVSPEGTRLALSSTDGYITVLRLADDHILVHYKVHADSIGCLAWSPDGRRIASAGNDGIVSLSDPDTNAVIQRLGTAGATSDALYVETVDFSPDGKQFAAACQDKLVHVWETDTGKALWQAAMHDKSIWQLRCSQRTCPTSKMRSRQWKRPDQPRHENSTQYDGSTRHSYVLLFAQRSRADAEWSVEGIHDFS